MTVFRLLGEFVTLWLLLTVTSVLCMFIWLFVGVGPFMAITAFKPPEYSQLFFMSPLLFSLPSCLVLYATTMISKSVSRSVLVILAIFCPVVYFVSVAIAWADIAPIIFALFALIPLIACGAFAMRTPLQPSSKRVLSVRFGTLYPCAYFIWAALSWGDTLDEPAVFALFGLVPLIISGAISGAVMPRIVKLFGARPSATSTG